ncbi:MAG TPA: membrane protein insertase YidC, partial [Burkholderiales bacterium]|nr:membrane protein insertase YidC [Burkholderiales bacterium]
LLFIALSFILLTIWQAWEQQNAPPPSPAAATTPASASTGQPVPAPGEVPAVPQTPTGDDRPIATPTVSALGHAERIEIVTDLFQAGIDTLGGDLREVKLRKHPVSADRPDAPFRLMGDEGEIFVAQSGLIGTSGDLPSHKTRYTAVQRSYALNEKSDELRVPLTYQSKDGLRYTKTFVFRRNSYAVDVEFTVVNTGKTSWTGYLYNQFQRSYVDTSGGLTTIATFTGAAIYTPENKFEKISFEDMANKALKREATGGWTAMLQHYFVAGYMPLKSERIELYTDVVNNARYVAGYKQLQPTTVAAGQSSVLSTRLYAGPKEQHRLELLACSDADLSKKPCAPAEQTRAPGMELTVDYGALTFISAPLFWLLEWLYKLIGNWGWAIVVLTCLVKLAFYPLSAMSYKSMAQMRKVQPKLEAIKQQYGHDRQQMNQAMMELYRTEKINPFGGCLPILVQIPVFIALYWVLLESVEMRQAPWMLWIKDLSSKDPYYVLPLIMGATMYLQQKLSPQPPDPIQRKVFMVMPVIFTGMFIFFPSGLVLYWTVNNILSILQQWRINQVMGANK